MTTLNLRKSIDRSPLRLGFLLIVLAPACFVLSPQARAVCQEGCDLINANTFLGDDAFVNNTTGYENTAIGDVALFQNTTGFQNTATGNAALNANTTGFANTATGHIALVANTTGYYNTVNGAYALSYNTTGHFNTATGGQALQSNVDGNANTATGDVALFRNKSGNNNTAIGSQALLSNVTGNNNTAIGNVALNMNTHGSYNIALGNRAGSNLTTGDRNIDIGNAGVAGESSIIRIGRIGDQTTTFIAGISGATVPTGIAVIVDADGHLGTTTSSARFKEAIRPMDKASEAILALKPVTFRYKHDLDPEGIPQFGLVAEQVEKVNPHLVARDEQGKPYTVRYEAVNAMLLNEFLKEHQTVLELKSAAVKQEAMIARQQKQIDALAASLQKVSAQLELGKTAPRTVLNNQ